MAKKQQKSRIAAMISIVVALLCVSSLLIFGLMAMRGSFSRTGERIVISNIIIEIFSKDPTGDLTIVRDISKRYDGMIVGEDPLSIRLKKGRVNSFISSMDKILVFPRGTSEKVEDFVGPLMENDEVIVKVKFISENN
ncbi:MAG: hypothetical protein HQ579_09210 [Candidatus Omnitrophica bacterium]|nr:hypothetical protein [Candidatus Omnitrophota bacterium]